MKKKKRSNRVHWTKEQYDAYLAKNFPGRVADSFTNVESDNRNESVGKKAPARFNTLCSIHFHSIRNRLADNDNISGKAALDGLVYAGILEDDSPAYVKAVTFSQEKIPGGEIETTSITIKENRA